MSRMTRSTDAGAAAFGNSSTRSPIPIDHDAGVRGADQDIVGEDPAMGVELLARLEGDRVDASLRARELHPVASYEGAGRRAGGAHRAAPARKPSTPARSAGVRPSRLSQR